jgi:superoxide dismutase, Cu-Zn family
MTKTTRRATTALVAMAAAAGVLITTGSTAGAVRPLARATLRDVAGSAIGTVVFSGSGANAERVTVELALPAGAPGLGSYHGFHIHTVGSCGAAFAEAAGHWNTVAGAKHGSHTGDLSSILVAGDGTASATFDTQRFSVSDLFDSDGSAVILHAGPDNFGNVPISSGKYEDPNDWYNTAPGGTGFTGDAGSRYACGIVERA